MYGFHSKISLSSPPDKQYFPVSIIYKKRISKRKTLNQREKIKWVRVDKKMERDVDESMGGEGFTVPTNCEDRTLVTL